MGEAAGGVTTLENQMYPVATRTRRRGLKFAGTARSSPVGTSLNSTMIAVQWDHSTYSNEMPLQVRFRATVGGIHFTGEIGTEGSTATSRLISGAGSTVFTSTAVSTWTEYENVFENYKAKSEDGVTSNVLGYIKASSTGRSVPQYEVLTVPRMKP